MNEGVIKNKTESFNSRRASSSYPSSEDHLQVILHHLLLPRQLDHHHDVSQ